MLREELDERKNYIVRLETQSKATETELNNKIEILQNSISDDKTKIQVKNSEIAQLKIDNHTQISQIEQLQKKLKENESENEQTKEKLENLRKKNQESSSSRNTKFNEELNELKETT